MPVRKLYKETRQTPGGKFGDPSLGDLGSAGMPEKGAVVTKADIIRKGRYAKPVGYWENRLSNAMGLEESTVQQQSATRDVTDTTQRIVNELLEEENRDVSYEELVKTANESHQQSLDRFVANPTALTGPELLRIAKEHFQSRPDAMLGSM